MSKIHRLKTWPEHFKDIESLCKRAETRIDDRGYQTGDLLILLEYIPGKKAYTGNALIRRVTHVLRSHDGLKPGYVVMSIREIPVQSGACTLCKCTEFNCRKCIEKTGSPCEWVDKRETLCSACAFEGIPEEEVVYDQG